MSLQRIDEIRIIKARMRQQICSGKPEQEKKLTREVYRINVIQRIVLALIGEVRYKLLIIILQILVKLDFLSFGTDLPKTILAMRIKI